MPTAGLEQCPDCQADLSALTPPGCCPNCGFEFDRHTRAWRSRRSWQHYAVAYGLLGLGVGLLVTVSYRLRFGEVPNALLPVATGLSVAVLGLLMHRVLSGRMSGRFVALTPRGILVGTRRRGLLVPWDDVRRVSARGHVPKIKRRSRSNSVPLEDVFDGPAELAAFQEAVKEARRRHTQASESSAAGRAQGE